MPRPSSTPKTGPTRTFSHLKNLLVHYAQRTRKNQTLLSYPFRLAVYCSLFFTKQRKGVSRNERIAAIVLSWKRSGNLPLVIAGLKKQSCIDDIFIFHNHPSRFWIPGCRNIFSENNRGCIARHELAATLTGYDYFIFSDDDLELRGDCASEILPAIRRYGDESVLGFFGHTLNMQTKEHTYTTGTFTTADTTVAPVDIIKGRFHIISHKGVAALATLGLDTPALNSEDDIRANVALQMTFGKPGYLIPVSHPIIDLNAPHARELRDEHAAYRDQAVHDGLRAGWKPTSVQKNI